MRTGQTNRLVAPVLTRSPSGALLPFLWEGSPTKKDYRKKGALILTSLLEDLVDLLPSTLRMVVWA